MNTSTTVIGVIVIVLIALGAWWFLTQPQPDNNTNIDINQQASTTNNNSTTTDSGADVSVGGSVTITPLQATVTYGSSGFSPKSVTIAQGGTVTFVNESGGAMWVASDEHPTHTEFDSTSRTTHCAAGYTGAKPFDQCGTGASYSFKFDKMGTFDYHNHSASQFGGMVVVK